MPPIRQLSQSLINKIAAGEVIERPASVVKELMENAVDAGATRIHVSVGKGGSEMVRVVDNGCGIAPDELPLAVASHATSKITEADDLFRVGTLGFRGEALASIAEVSWLVLRSRTADSPSGTEIDVVGGKPGEVVPCGVPVGTTVEVRNLFFNTPVRRKFLRTTQTEFGHAGDAFIRIALAMPRIDFTLEHDGRQVYELSAASTHLERIARFFGSDLADHLIWVESDEGEVHVSGYVAHPSHSRGNNRMQYLFLNGRYIRDRSLQHALREAYRGLLLTVDAAGDGRRERPPHEARSPVPGLRPALQPVALHAADEVSLDRPDCPSRVGPDRVGSKRSERLARRGSGGRSAPGVRRLGQGQGRLVADATGGRH
jgi:DNA mismatch repair protein MutL